MAHSGTETQRTSRLVRRRPTPNSENASSKPRVNSRQITGLASSNSERSSMCGSILEPPISNLQNLPGASETPRVLGRLIGTPERLEVRLTRRKQSTECRPNRYSSHRTSWRQHLASTWAANGRLAFHESRTTGHESRVPGSDHEPGFRRPVFGRSRNTSHESRASRCYNLSSGNIPARSASVS
jgi:hypothetical protein